MSEPKIPEEEFRIPVTWEMCGWVTVKAANVKDALLNFDPDAHELPQDSTYVDGSFVLTSDDPDTVEAMTPSLDEP
jgi:hypothetical protein